MASCNPFMRNERERPYWSTALSIWGFWNLLSSKVGGTSLQPGGVQRRLWALGWWLQYPYLFLDSQGWSQSLGNQVWDPFPVCAKKLWPSHGVG